MYSAKQSHEISPASFWLECMASFVACIAVCATLCSAANPHLHFCNHTRHVKLLTTSYVELAGVTPGAGLHTCQALIELDFRMCTITALAVFLTPSKCTFLLSHRNGRTAVYLSVRMLSHPHDLKACQSFVLSMPRQHTSCYSMFAGLASLARIIS